jgi:hypothetical protein
LPDADSTIPNSSEVAMLSGSYSDPSWITSLSTSKLTGNFVSTITGSANQVLVNGTTGTPQSGAITLTLPQFIGTSSTPQFQALTLSGPGSGLNFINNSAISGQAIAPVNFLGLDSAAAPNFYGRIICTINDNTAGTEQGNLNFLVSQIGSGVLTSYMEIDGTTESITLKKLASFLDDASISTAGKTLKIKQGSNACAGTGAVLVGGTVTVNTTAVATGDIILLNCTAAGGSQGFVRTSISNGVSFTITSSSALDTSTYSWVIVKAA